MNEPKLMWKEVETGRLIDGAVPFVPVTRAVWAVKSDDGRWREISESEVELWRRR